jgi:hypothetical protein
LNRICLIAGSPRISRVSWLWETCNAVRRVRGTCAR